MDSKFRGVNIPTIDFSHTAFNLLMQKRIRKVLIISSEYDFFILEEDGRIDEQIFNEYVSLNLRYPPIFIKATNIKEAFEIIKEQDIDLVIEMLNLGEDDAFSLAKRIRNKYSKVPIVVLTHFNRAVSIRLQNEDMSAIDHVFCWLGNADLLLAIIKLIEDKMNAPHDIDEVGVQCIILVEDSVRYYSTYLPELYRIVMQQTRNFVKEALNEHQKMLRMRGRPKILLAKNYDEALELYTHYKENLLGIISDVSFKKGDKRDQEEKLGIKLIEHIRAEDPHLPALLQSSDLSNEKLASEMGVGFLHKYSKSLSHNLRNYIIQNFAFGEFIFRKPETSEEVTRAVDLQTLQQKILEVPDDVLTFHVDRNHFSKWLNARAIFPVAQLFKYVGREDFKNVDEIRRFLHDAISSYRISKGRGIIAKFDKNSYDAYKTFSRIGEESIGGKARGLAFINTVIDKHNLFNKYPNALITVPRTVVLSTDVFDEFMELNGLFRIALSDLPDDEILDHFVSSKLPGWLHQDLYTVISASEAPLAVRSSSKLEDSHYQPFAGIYSTYMIPLNKEDPARTMELLTCAIKSVYASVYFKESKAYIEATSNVIDEEKMGIILQEVCGARHGDYYYPTISGVARSVNFYPIAPEKIGDGMAKVAYGLGKYIVDGGISLRFSPCYPRKILQLSSSKSMLRDTQKQFYALNLKEERFYASTNDAVNLERLKIADAEGDAAFRQVASVYDYQSDLVRDGTTYQGKKIITFSGILQHETFPLAEIIRELLQIGQKEMNLPIEIEFAVNLEVPAGQPGVFNFLQIRPIVETDQRSDIEMDRVEPGDTILYSQSALGNGEFSGIRDIIYLKPENFNASGSREIAERMEELNQAFKERAGSDPDLGRSGPAPAQAQSRSAHDQNPSEEGQTDPAPAGSNADLGRSGPSQQPSDAAPSSSDAVPSSSDAAPSSSDAVQSGSGSDQAPSASDQASSDAAPASSDPVPASSDAVQSGSGSDQAPSAPAQPPSDAAQASSAPGQAPSDLKPGKGYVLIGPGRWGSSDPWLGIPVKWSQISEARIIVESGLENYRIDPSQGTHFFQNLTSFRVGYMTINPFIQDGYYDPGFLDKLPAVYEDKYIRHVRFDTDLVIRIDGKTNRGAVMKP